MNIGVTFKIPQSVLVVIYTPALDVLLIKRCDAPENYDFWQSVTGSKDSMDESFECTARREVFEETAIDCRPGTPLACRLQDWQTTNVYEIYPQWRYRYAPGIVLNTEHVFGLEVPAGTPVRLSPKSKAKKLCCAAGTDRVWARLMRGPPRC